MNLLTGGITGSSNTKKNSDLTANLSESEDDEEPIIFPRTRSEDICCPAKPDDLARTVQAVLLQRGLMDPLPIEYNSHLLNVLSEFFKMETRMRKKQKKWQAVVRHHEWERQEWSLLADDWLKRENRYKAEVKRLELLISKTSDRGVEAVHVARSNSVIDRSGTKKMAARIAKLKESYEETGTSPKKENYELSSISYMMETADRVIEDEGHCSESHCHPEGKSSGKNKEGNRTAKTYKMEDPKVGPSHGKGKTAVAAETRKFNCSS